MNNDNKRIQSLIEGAGILGVVVLLGLLSIYFVPFLLILYPLGFIVYGLKHGLNPAIVLIILTSSILGVVVDLTSGIVILGLFGPATIAIIFSMRKRRRPLEVLLTGSLVFFASSIILFGVMGNVTGISVIEEMEQTFKETVVLQLEVLEGMGMSNYEIDSTRIMLEDAYKYILLIFPAILMLLSFLVSYLNYLVSVWLLRLWGIGVLPMPFLHKFSVPNNFSIGVVAMFLGVFIAKQFNTSYYDTIFLNLIVLVGLVFILQGLAVLDFYLIKLKMKSLFRGIVIFMIIAVSPLLTLISLVGGIDVVIDFRKIRRRKSH